MNATAVLEAAEKRRTQAPAGDSETSSRGHVIMLAYLEQRDSNGVLAQVRHRTQHTRQF